MELKLGLEEELIGLFEDSNEFKIYNKYVTYIEDKYFSKSCCIYEIQHSRRVLYLNMINCMLNNLNCIESKILAIASCFHNIDGFHGNNGMESCEKMKTLDIYNTLIQDLVDDKIKIIEFIVSNHLADNDKAFDDVQGITDINLCRKLYNYFKDSYMLGETKDNIHSDINEFRNDTSKLLINLSIDLFNEDNDSTSLSPKNSTSIEWYRVLFEKSYGENKYKTAILWYCASSSIINNNIDRNYIESIFEKSYKYTPIEFIDKLKHDINPGHDYIDVYRGCRNKTIYNYSWSTSKNIATAYSLRHKDNLRVIHAKVKKSNIFAIRDAEIDSCEVIIKRPYEIDIVKIYTKDDIKKEFPLLFMSSDNSKSTAYKK